MVGLWLTLLLAGIAAGARAQELRPDFDAPRSLETLIRQAALPARALRPSPASPIASEWTVMVYLNAKNDLEKNSYADIKQMESVGSTRQVKVVLEFATITTGLRRMLIGKHADTGKIESPVLARQRRVDMGDWRHLADFVRWSKERFPARHYLLVVWSHGSGWRFDDMGAIKKVGISRDDETSSHISVPELKRALQEAGGVDVYASDACLMQQAEVAYELKDWVRLIVGSEAMLHPDGFAYDRFLSKLTTRPTMGADLVGKALVDSYRMSEEDEFRGTLSAIRTSALPRLLSLLDEWSAQLMAANESTAVRLAAEEVLEFDDADSDAEGSSVDIGDFVRLVSRNCASPRIRALSQDILAHINAELTADNTHGTDYLASSGLSVYLSRCEYDPRYDRLSWAKDGGWAAFVKWSTTAVRDCPSAGSRRMARIYP